LGTAGQKQRKKLANTLRDADHMALFVDHANKIDFFQVMVPRCSRSRGESEASAR